MENHHISDADREPEDFSERFLCCVCLDLLYKPIVLSCGHITCFWCVHRSMNGKHKSHCPLCRHPYHHFPAICQLLHCLLLKLYPVASKRRESQTLEEEAETGVFSPQLDVQAWSSQANQESNVLGYSISKELTANMETTGSVSYDQNDGTAVSRPADGGDYEGKENVTDHVKNSLLSHQQSGSSKQISVADVLCAACKDLVFRPVVLNCGHVYCESCMSTQMNRSLDVKFVQVSIQLDVQKFVWNCTTFWSNSFPKNLHIEEMMYSLSMLIQLHVKAKAKAVKKQRGHHRGHITQELAAIIVECVQ
ncbi:PREDICTED: E3 ubiquitin-protein ligase PRT1-like [Fragaria vesca subsp. vesca]